MPRDDTQGRGPRRRRRRFAVVAAVAIAVPALALLAFTVYVRVATYQPEPEALDAALAHPVVSVEREQRHWVIDSAPGALTVPLRR